MSITRLKLVYALYTIAVAVFVAVQTRRGAEPIWVLWVYLATTSAFAVWIITTTFHAANRTGAVTLGRLGQLFVSVGTALPLMFGLLMLWQEGPVTAGLAFLLTSAVTALVYVLVRAIRTAQRGLSHSS